MSLGGAGKDGVAATGPDDMASETVSDFWAVG